MSIVGRKLTVPCNRFLIDIETALDGAVTINITQAKPLRIIDTVTLKGHSLSQLRNIVSDAWESQG